MGMMLALTMGGAAGVRRMRATPAVPTAAAAAAAAATPTKGRPSKAVLGKQH